MSGAERGDGGAVGGDGGECTRECGSRRLVATRRRRPAGGACGCAAALLLAANALVVVSPCSELRSLGTREHFEACAAPGDGGAHACVPTCVVAVPGCTDSRKTNYDPAANTDDGSCDENPCLTAENNCDENARCGHIGPGAFVCVCKAELGYVGDGLQCMKPIYACTYEQAANYDARCALAVGACIEDGSCVFLAAGCMDPGADNYDPAAGVDDGSCYVYGCTRPGADNYHPLATTDCVEWGEEGSCNARNDSCVITGCREPRADNYNAEANLADESCVYTLPGCTYNGSINYNATANVDDGTCIPIQRGCTNPNATNFEPDANLDDDSCQWIPCSASENDCHQNATCTHMGPQTHICQCRDAFVGNGSHCVPTVLGCTDPAAFNFDPAANLDDGGCRAVVFGCTDAQAYNFAPSANTDDGGCIARVCGCTDPLAINFADEANTDDGSCDRDPCAMGSHSCSADALCSYVPVHANETYRSQWDGSACQRVRDAEPARGCSQAAEGLRACGATGSCVATGHCPEEPGDPLAVAACSYLSESSGFVPCGYRRCVPRALADTCLAGTYSCRCRSTHVGDGHRCEPRLLGCTDAAAFNYLAGANIDNGSCIPVVAGCTDSMARNYNRLANTDDGSCVVHPCNSTLHGCSEHARCSVVGPNEHRCACLEGYGGNGTRCVMVPGCTYPRADNYNENATADDGSCWFRIGGCTDPNATNFVAEVGANYDDGSCMYVRAGCTYAGAYNYDPAANVDDRSCIVNPVFGCTDPAAWNFDPGANVNSSCIPKVFGCTDARAYNYDAANTDDGSCNYDACLSQTHDCDTHAACNFTAPLAFNCTCNQGYIGNGTWCEPVRRGCMAEDAWNYDESANVEDGSCIARSFGCTDADQFNYESEANTDDGSCVPVVAGCTTDTALNFEPSANRNTSDCADPAAAVLKIYVGSHGYQMGWVVESSTHGLNFSMDFGVLTGREYDSTLEGYGYVHRLRLPAGEWKFTGLDEGRNGWPGSQLRIDRPAESCVAIDRTAAADAEVCAAWQMGQSPDTCGALSHGDASGPVCRHIAGTAVMQEQFGSKAGKISFANSFSMTFSVPCSHHRHCARFEYCDEENRCKSCGAIGESAHCEARNDSLSIPVADTVLERSRRAQPPPVGLGEVWHTAECPSKCESIFGCTRPHALNFNETANTDDGSCQIMGCRSTRATNFDAEATVDDGTSCRILGCTDSAAFNFDPAATEDNSSCIPKVFACTNPVALNYNATANVDDRSCNINPCDAEGYAPDCHGNATCRHIGPELYTCRCTGTLVGNGIDCWPAASAPRDDPAPPTPLVGSTQGGTAVTVQLASLDWAATELAYEKDVVPGLPDGREPHSLCGQGELRTAAGVLDDGSGPKSSFNRSMACGRLLRAPSSAHWVRITFLEWTVADMDACAVLSPGLRECNGSCVPDGSCGLRHNGDALRLFSGENTTADCVGAFGADDSVEFGTIYVQGPTVFVDFQSDSHLDSCGPERCSFSLEWSFVDASALASENSTVPPHTVLAIPSLGDLHQTSSQFLERQQHTSLRMPPGMRVGTNRLRCRFGGALVVAEMFDNVQLVCAAPSSGTVGHREFDVVFMGDDKHVTRIPWANSTTRAFQYAEAAVLVAVESPSAYHQWLHPITGLPEAGHIGFGPATGGSRTILRGYHFAADLASLCCRWTPVFAAGSVPATVVPAHRISNTSVLCVSPPVSLGRQQQLFEVDVSLNGQQFTGGRLMYLFYEPLTIRKIEPQSAPSVGGRHLGWRHASGSEHSYVSVAALVENTPSRDDLGCKPLGLASCGTATCVPLAACDAHQQADASSVSSQITCRWRRFMQLEEAESQLQASEGEQRCDQDGCFHYADAALPVRTGCYIDRTAECAPTGCCFEELVVVAELQRDGSGTMTCTAAQPVSPGSYSFDVARNGQDYAGSAFPFTFTAQSAVDIVTVAADSGEVCDLNLYGRGFVNGTEVSIRTSSSGDDVLLAAEYLSASHMAVSVACAPEAFSDVAPVTVVTNGQQYHVDNARVAVNGMLGPSESFHIGSDWLHPSVSLAGMFDMALVETSARPVFVAGDTSRIGIRVRETFGPLVNSGFQFAVVLQCAATHEAMPPWQHPRCIALRPPVVGSAGHFTAHYAPTVAGIYDLAVTREDTGQHVGASPLRTRILPAVATAENSQLASIASSVTAGDSSPVFLIRPYDHFGNPRNTTGDGRRYCVDARRSDSNSSSEQCLVCNPCQSPDERGVHWREVSADGSMSSQSRCFPATEANDTRGRRQCEESPCGAVCESEQGGYEFILNIVEATVVSLRVSLGPPTELVPCGNGACVPISSCADTDHDDRCLALTARAIVDRPFNVAVLADRTDPAACRTTGSGLIRALVGVPSTLIVTARDKYGNRRTVGGDLFGWSLVQASHCVPREQCDAAENLTSCSNLGGAFAGCASTRFHTGQALDLRNGEYSLQYRPLAQGTYVLSVWLATDGRNVSVAGSPWAGIQAYGLPEMEDSSGSGSWESDSYSGSDSASWLSVTDENGSYAARNASGGVDGDTLESRGLDDSASGSASWSGSWSQTYGNASAGDAPRSLDECEGIRESRFLADATATLDRSLFDVDINLGDSSVAAFGQRNDCAAFIASIERPGWRSGDICSAVLGGAFVQCGSEPVCVTRAFCDSRLLTDISSALGRDSVCRFVSSNLFRVSVSQGGMLRPGDRVTMRRCSMKLEAAGDQIVLASAAVDLAAPAIPSTPFVLLSAPSEIGACNVLELDGTLSSVAGPQLPEVKWSLESRDGGDRGSIDAVLARASSEGAQQVRVNLDALTKAGFGEYIFNLTLRNVISGASASATHRVVRVQSDAPSIRLSQTRLQIRSWQPIELEAFADRPACSAELGQADLHFRWNGTRSLRAASSETSLLYLPPRTMMPGDTAEIFVSVTTSTVTPGTARAVVECISEPVIASIRSGNRVVPNNLVFSIDASASVDPDALPDPFVYSVQCRPVEDGHGVAYESERSFGCVAGDGVYVAGTTTSTYKTHLPASIAAINHDSGSVLINWPDGDTRHRQTDVSRIYKDDVACSELIVITYPECNPSAGPLQANAGLFTFDARRLDRGARYLFSVTASKGSRADNASVFVTVSEYDVTPTVAIDYDVKVKYNPGDRLVLQARQASGLPFETAGPVRLSWSLTDAASTPIPITAPGFLRAPAGSNLVLNPSVLSAGGCYAFQASAVAVATGATAFASVDLCMNSPPASGTLTVSPQAGAAISTEFTLRAAGWWDDDTPLRYMFGFELHGHSTSLAFTSARVMATVLPPGDQYPLTLQVHDVYAAVSNVVQQSVQVDEYVPAVSLSLDMETAIADAQSAGDVSSVGLLVDVFAALLLQLRSRRRLQSVEIVATSTAEIDRSLEILVSTLWRLVLQLPKVADTASRLAGSLQMALDGEFPGTVVADGVGVVDVLSESPGLRDETVDALLDCASALLHSVATKGGTTGEKAHAIRLLEVVLDNLVAAASLPRLPGEFPRTVAVQSFDLSIRTETGADLDGLDLGAVRLPAGVFPNTTAPMHVQSLLWHVNPHFWADERPADIAANLTVGADVLTFAARVIEESVAPPKTYSGRVTPFIARLPKHPSVRADNNQTHWHCAVWDGGRLAWVLGGDLADWRGDNVTCAHAQPELYTDRFATLTVFWGSIPPAEVIPVNSLAFYVGAIAPGAIALSGLLLSFQHARLWKNLGMMVARKKAVQSYLSSIYAAYAYGRKKGCCLKAVHNLRVRVSLYAVVWGYHNVPHQPRALPLLVMLSDIATLTCANAMFFSPVDQLWQACVVALAAVPTHLAVDYALKWLVRPTEEWLRAEFEVQQSTASASFKGKGLRSKSLGSRKSFKSGSGSGLASPSAASSIGGSPSFLSPSMSTLTGVAGSDGVSLSHARHRSVLDVMTVVGCIWFLAVLWSGLTTLITLRWPTADFITLVVRTGVSCGTKWTAIDPVLAFTAIPLLARWDAARRARRTQPYSPSEDGGDGEQSPVSPRQDEGLDVPEMETKLERQARDRKARIAGPKHFEWKRDVDIGSFKVHTLKALEPEKAVVPTERKEPAVRVKKQTRAKGVVTKAFTDRLARREGPSDAPNAGAAGAGLPGLLEVEASADKADKADAEPAGPEPLEPKVDGSWRLTRHVTKGGYSWRASPFRVRLPGEQSASGEESSSADETEAETEYSEGTASSMDSAALRRAELRKNLSRLTAAASDAGRLEVVEGRIRRLPPAPAQKGVKPAAARSKKQLPFGRRLPAALRLED